eukprot:CAMPEP_0177674446 /NCGR_PEP_ID=MMETSP0447-20121125/26562_1 /TAXON_ID=0 /ORGANISM="Stygamoeba regulata, Strain BSH-02190019" /LENGTH=689 /DNA_ID=CAMNT_0019182547 /DNA_START=154 /DNA_END=2223 /DNA_ORIENTATION=-
MAESISESTREFLACSIFSKAVCEALCHTYPESTLFENLRDIGEGAKLLNLFFHRCTSAELKATIQIECCFRQESLATRVTAGCLQVHSKRFREFLECLIVNTVPSYDLEIDPTRLPDAKRREKNLAELRALLKLLLTKIFGFFHDVETADQTYEMCTLLSSLAYLAETNLEGSAQSAVTNMLFLRCVCPFITSLGQRVPPAAADAQTTQSGSSSPFMARLLKLSKTDKTDKTDKEKAKGMPSPRNLTLVCKVLQTLANKQQLGEHYMLPLNDVVVTYRERLDMLVQSIVDAPCHDIRELMDPAEPPMMTYDTMKALVGSVVGMVNERMLAIKKSCPPATYSTFRSITKLLTTLFVHRPAETEASFKALITTRAVRDILPRSPVSPSVSIKASTSATPEAADAPHCVEFAPSSLGGSLPPQSAAGKRRLCSSMSGDLRERCNPRVAASPGPGVKRKGGSRVGTRRESTGDIPTPAGGSTRKVPSKSMSTEADDAFVLVPRRKGASLQDMYEEDYAGSPGTRKAVDWRDSMDASEEEYRMPASSGSSVQMRGDQPVCVKKAAAGARPSMELELDLLRLHVESMDIGSPNASKAGPARKGSLPTLGQGVDDSFVWWSRVVGVPLDELMVLMELPPDVLRGGTNWTLAHSMQFIPTGSYKQSRRYMAVLLRMEAMLCDFQLSMAQRDRKMLG